MVDLPLYYLKLVYSVLRIIPHVCMIIWILNSIHHLIVIGRHILMSEHIKSLESSNWIGVRHISLISVVQIVVSSTIDTHKLIHTCIIFCLMTVCIGGSRINAQVILSYNMSGALRRLIYLYLIEIMLIFWSKKVLLKIIISIILVSIGLHRPRILKGVMHELLSELTRSLLDIIMSINAAL